MFFFCAKRVEDLQFTDLTTERPLPFLFGQVPRPADPGDVRPAGADGDVQVVPERGRGRPVPGAAAPVAAAGAARPLRLRRHLLLHLGDGAGASHVDTLDPRRLGQRQLLLRHHPGLQRGAGEAAAQCCICV